jgi:hypothetical protein
VNYIGSKFTLSSFLEESIKQTQKEIVSILDKSFESEDNMLKYIEDSLDKVKLLKRALLRDAFNGKI